MDFIITLNRPALLEARQRAEVGHDLLLQAKRESDPRLQIMIFRRATLIREGMKTPNRTGNIGQRPKKMRFPVGKMVGEEGFEPPTNGV